MNYYEQKQLQDRENRMIGAGVSFILLSPAFGIAALIVSPTNAAFYGTTALSIFVGIICIAAGIKEKKERRNITS